jgi:hypothetical protein
MLVTLNKSLVVQRIGKLSDSAFARIHHAICLNINSSHSLQNTKLDGYKSKQEHTLLTLED